MQQKVLCNWGMTLKQSSAVHIQASYSADGILPGFCWLTSAFIINLASVPGRQLVNSQTAAILERCLHGYVIASNFGGYKKKRLAKKRALNS